MKRAGFGILGIVFLASASFGILKMYDSYHQSQTLLAQQQQSLVLAQQTIKDLIANASSSAAAS
jgi:hypothetical protein